MSYGSRAFADGDDGLYVRGVSDRADALKTLLGDAPSTTVVVFDDGLDVSELEEGDWGVQNRLRRSMQPWVDALDRVAESHGDDDHLYVAHASEPFPVAVGAEGWRDVVLPATHRGVNYAHRIDAVSAGEWIRAVAEARPGAHIVFVYRDARSLSRRLRSTMECSDEEDSRATPYWPEAEVMGHLQASGCRLSVIGPEAPFGMETPWPELPLVPWSSRPCRGTDRLGEFGLLAVDLLPKSGLSSATDPEQLMEEAIRVSRISRSFLASREWLFEGHELVRRPVRDERRLRFRSMMPRYTWDGPGTTPRVSDVPSGFGLWSLARAARASGGRYALLAPNEQWLDVCRVPPDERATIAPDLGPAADAQRRAEADSALREIAELVEQLETVTPVAVSAGSSSTPTQWWGWRVADARAEWRPVSTDGVFPMNELPRTIGEAIDLSRRVRSVALPAYDRASQRLERFVAKQQRDGWEGVSARSRGSLLLFWYWIEQSAWNMDSFAVLVDEAQHVRRPRRDAEFDVGVVDQVRISDLVDAPDSCGGHRTPQSLVARKLHPLLSPVTSPAHRARRDIADVEADVDRALHKRLRRLVEVADTVLRESPAGPWQWSVYYSALEGYLPLAEDAVFRDVLGGTTFGRIQVPASE